MSRERRSWEHGLRLFFGESQPQQIASADGLRFIGLWDSSAKPRTLTIKGKKYECSLKKGGQTKALLFNVLGTEDCKPFVNRARVVGQRKGEVIHADEIYLQPIGDQSASDDPTLPRYLFIGDSISGNYDKGPVPNGGGCQVLLTVSTGRGWVGE